MRFMQWSKDGGPDSAVWGFYLIEIKPLFSIVLLKFEVGGRTVFHNHAFNAISFLLKGGIDEFTLPLGKTAKTYLPSLKPIYTPRRRMHRVISYGTSWALTFRGPWVKLWMEIDPATRETTILTHGRRVHAKYRTQVRSNHARKDI